jgi:hypothetical protein
MEATYLVEGEPSISTIANIFKAAKLLNIE